MNIEWMAAFLSPSQSYVFPAFAGSPGSGMVLNALIIPFRWTPHPPALPGTSLPSLGLPAPMTDGASQTWTHGPSSFRTNRHKDSGGGASPEKPVAGRRGVRGPPSLHPETESQREVTNCMPVSNLPPKGTYNKQLGAPTARLGGRRERK